MLAATHVLYLVFLLRGQISGYLIWRSQCHRVRPRDILAGIKISVFIPFANIAKISSTLKFVVLQYTCRNKFSIYSRSTCISKCKNLPLQLKHVQYYYSPVISGTVKASSID